MITLFMSQKPKMNSNLKELQTIQGVGSGKANKYGKEFVKLIGIYVEENDIDRPQDLIVKSVVKKSGVKVFIIPFFEGFLHVFFLPINFDFVNPFQTVPYG